MAFVNIPTFRHNQNLAYSTTKVKRKKDYAPRGGGAPSDFSIVLLGITFFIGLICSILILTNLRKSISEDLFRSSPLEKNYVFSNFDWSLITIVSVSNTTIHLLSSNTLQQNLITFLAILIFYHLISINHFIFRTKVKKGIYYIFLAELLINIILILPILLNS